MISKIRVRGYRIHRDLTIRPNKRLNLIVGANEAGKSTLMEAIVLALTGRINGRSAADEINPYWFHTGVVAEYLYRAKNGERPPLPEIDIELFLDDVPEMQVICGAHNSELPTMACPGVRFRCIPNKEYVAELEAWAANPTPFIPVEYYEIDWRGFCDTKLSARPKGLATAIIDSRTLRSTSGVDHHLRQILSSQIAPAERASIALRFREVKASLSETAFKEVNERLGTLHSGLHSRPVALAMDQSARASWEESVSPQVGDVPFAMSGQGQQSAIKIALAMNKHAGRVKFVIIEEPENHLSHTGLTTLLHRMEKLTSDDQQLFITTHSSFVSNRLGLDALQLLGPAAPVKLTELSPDTAKYFQKLPGFDTLRIVLASKVVLVEGPSDEIVFERVFHDIYGKRPMECGIDVFSMRGLSIARGLELCSRLGKMVAVIRDNDGVDPVDLIEPLKEWLKGGEREVFIGEVAHGHTLEPQLIHHCGEPSLRKILGMTLKADLETWMKREKTEAALKIAATAETVVPPDYMLRAAKFING